MTKQYKMKMLPPELRPYERFANYGPESLSDAELLAILLRTGQKGLNVVRMAENILQQAGEDGLLGLCRYSVKELMEHPGIGQVKAIQIKAVAELARRMTKKSAKKRLMFNSPDTIAQYYMEDLRYEDRENLIILSLNTKGALIGEKLLYVGTVNSSLISPREVFIEALQNKAVSIIMLHNHPSGDPTPSHQDIFITKKIKEAGELLDISLVDHIIIGDNIYVSLKERNLL